MREAVIVSTARTPIARAYKGAFNDIKSPTLLAHALRAALERSGVQPDEIEDVVIGTVLSSGTAGMNLARNAAIAAGFGLCRWLFFKKRIFNIPSKDSVSETDSLFFDFMQAWFVFV